MNTEPSIGRVQMAHVSAGFLCLLAFVISAFQSRAQCAVDWNDVHQRIDGFGASCAFSGRIWAGYTAQIFFSTNKDVVYFDKQSNAYTNNGLGLSLLRNQISPGGFADASELSLMKLAQALGVRIWSTPWSPQASFKSNGSTVGGNYLGNGANATNLAYAAQLANYVATNAAAGINIYAISIQNEPDAVVSYTSCNWTAQQIHDFTTNLYKAFQASNVLSTKIMLPEDESWQTNFYLATMSDTNSAADVGIIANHNYVANNLIGDQNPPAALPSYGKALWETEVATLSTTTVTNFFDPSITNAMYWATRIHLFMTVAQANAWHYWYLITGTSPSDNEGLEGTGDIPSKRMFAVGQFSRFIRPNYYRIGTTNATGNVMVSAYKDSVSPSFAIVAINTNTSSVDESFNLTNFNATSVTPWLTTSNLSLASTNAITVSNAFFIYTLPAMSVVTFVGQAAVIPTNITISGASYAPTGPAFILTWNSTAGATYSVLRTNLLATPAMNWQVIVTGYPAGGAAGGSISYTDTTATLNRAFYRVRSP